MGRVLLWHLDGKLPNLALMRIAAHHRERGDQVDLRRVSDGASLGAEAWREIEPRFGDPSWDRVYASASFAGETHEQRDHRRRLLREFGCRPYPMPFVRTPELLGYQRWVVGAYDKGISWERWNAAHYNPRKLGDRFSLPLFGGE